MKHKLTVFLGVLALTLSATSAVLASPPVGHKVTICHATSSEKNPYVRPTVDVASAGYNGDDGGHAGHGRDGVWYPGAKADDFDWGDIIPPYEYNDFKYPGLNWTEEGQAIYENGCKSVPDEPAHEPEIDIVKTPSVTTLPVGGGSVTYTYKVTATGNVPLSEVSVSDNKCTPVTYVIGDTNNDEFLDLAEEWTFTCTTNLTATTTNTAVATGYDGDTPVQDSDVATVTVTPPSAGDDPEITIVKTPSVTTLPVGGGPVTYTYVVTNTGDVALSNVSVTDAKCAPVAYVSGDTNTNDDLDLTETWTYTCTATLTVTTTNTGIATGHAGEVTVTDDDDATVTVTPAGGAVAGETDVPTAPSTDLAGETSSPSGSLPILSLVLAIIGLGAVLLTRTRARR